MQKRGQVTAILIVVILILLSLFLYSYAKRENTYFKPRVIYPAQVEPIAAKIEKCMQDVGEKGMRALGHNGGYINFPPEIFASRDNYLSTVPGDAFKNPYWWHDGISVIPSQTFMAGQVEDYLESHIRSCFSFEEFADEFDIREVGPISAKAYLNDESVGLNLEYPLEVLNPVGTKVTDMKDFSTEVPLRLKYAWELSKKIMDAANRDHKLEKIALDLIFLDEDIPDTGFDMGCSPTFWSVAAVKSKFQLLLRANYPTLRIDKLVYEPIPDDRPYERSHYVWPVTDVQYPSTRAVVSYDPAWPMEFAVSPSDGHLLKSSPFQGQDLINFLCINMWKFTYTADFPVLITIQDEGGEGRKPYTFSFATKVSINNNYPDRSTKLKQDFNPITLSSSKEYCDQARENEMTILVRNNNTGEDIVDVNATFVCGKYTCPIGESQYLDSGSAAGLREKFPLCYNGVLTIKGREYLDYSGIVSTDKPGTHIARLVPSRRIYDVRVIEHDLDSPGYYRLLTDAQALIRIESDAYSSSSFYPTEFAEGSFDIEGFPLSTEKAVDQPLTFIRDDKTYDLSVYVVYGDKIIGGYKRDWRVTEQDLLSHSALDLHVWTKYDMDDEAATAFLMNLTEQSKRLPPPSWAGESTRDESPELVAGYFDLR